MHFRVLKSAQCREKFEQVISAEYIRQLKDLRMGVFKSKVWETLRGSALVTEKDRRVESQVSYDVSVRMVTANTVYVQNRYL